MYTLQASRPAALLPLPRPPHATERPPQLVVTPELVEQLAEALYNSLDPRFVDCDWHLATEETREWARARARRFLPVVIEQSTLLAAQLVTETVPGASDARR